MKQVQLKDAQENFVQIFEDVLMSGEPVEIPKETGNACSYYGYKDSVGLVR
jgi:hypothetical protein